MLMTERYRLLTHDASFRKVRRSYENTYDREHCRNDEGCTENAEPRERVCTAMEDLRHGEQFSRGCAGTLGSGGKKKEEDKENEEGLARSGRLGATWWSLTPAL